MQQGQRTSIWVVLAVSVLAGCESKEGSAGKNGNSENTAPVAIETTSRPRDKASWKAVAAPAAWHKGLRERLSAALPATVELVDARIAFNNLHRTWWIAGLRFTKPGFYVITHSFEYSFRGKTQTQRRVSKLWIGPKGTGRVHLRNRYTKRVSPVACVGDIVELPLRIHTTLSAHAIACHGPDQPGAGTKQLADIDYLQRFLGKAIQPEGRLAQAKLLAAGASGSVSRIGGPRGFTRYALGGLFQFLQEGKLTARASAVVDGKKRQRSLPIFILPADRPIRVLVPPGRSRLIGTEYFGTMPVVARVGDYLVTHFIEYTVTGDRSSEPRHPTVTLQGDSLDKQTWPFEYRPLDKTKAVDPPTTKKSKERLLTPFSLTPFSRFPWIYPRALVSWTIQMFFFGAIFERIMGRSDR